MSNLLAQRREIKRLEKENEKPGMEELEGVMERAQEERERGQLWISRKVMMGLEGGREKIVAATTDGKEVELVRKGDDSLKQKLVLDEDEMLKNARAEQ